MNIKPKSLRVATKLLYIDFQPTGAMPEGISSAESLAEKLGHFNITITTRRDGNRWYPSNIVAWVKKALTDPKASYKNPLKVQIMAEVDGRETTLIEV